MFNSHRAPLLSRLVFFRSGQRVRSKVLAHGSKHFINPTRTIASFSAPQITATGNCAKCLEPFAHAMKSTLGCGSKFAEAKRLAPTITLDFEKVAGSLRNASFCGTGTRILPLVKGSHLSSHPSLS